MEHQYRYWKTKRHVIHFIALMVSLAAFTILFWIDVFDYMKHMDASGNIDPNYQSPTTVAVVILSFLVVVAFIFFLFDLIFYLNVKKRLKKTNGNNIEINVKSEEKEVNKALDDAKAKLVTSGLVADVNAQTEIDAEYAYKMKLEVNTKETFPLFLYILYKPLTFALIILLTLNVGLNLLINIDNLSDAIIPIIVGTSVSILIIVLFFIVLVARANKGKRKAIFTTNELGIRIYADHLEQYNVIAKDGTEAEIRYKVPFLKMKYLETKKSFYCRSYNNGQVVALRLDKTQMPEEALILLKAKLKK